MCLKRAGSDGVGTAAKRARVDGPAASSLQQLDEHCRFATLAEMHLAHHSSVDPICVKTVKPGARNDVHSFGKVPRALLRDVWDHQRQAHVYEVLFPTPPPRSCPAVESAVAAEAAAAVAKVYLDLEPNKAQQTRGGITLAQGIRLLPLAFEVLSSALQESYGVAWRYDADRDALAVSCGRVTRTTKAAANATSGPPSNATTEYMKFSAHLIVNATIRIPHDEISDFKAALREAIETKRGDEAFAVDGISVADFMDTAVYKPNQPFKLPYSAKPGDADDRIQKPCSLRRDESGAWTLSSAGRSDLNAFLASHDPAGPVERLASIRAPAKAAARQTQKTGHTRASSDWDAYRRRVEKMAPPRPPGEHEETCEWYLRNMHVGGGLIDHFGWVEIMWCLREEGCPVKTFLDFMDRRDTKRPDAELRSKYESDRTKHKAKYGIGFLRRLAHMCGYETPPPPQQRVDRLLPVSDLVKGHYLPPELLDTLFKEGRTGVSIHAGTGNGKTVTINRFLANNPEERVLAISNGRSWAIDFAQKTGIDSYLDETCRVKDERVLQQSPRLIISLESLGRVARLVDGWNADGKGWTLILDESESIGACTMGEMLFKSKDALDNLELFQKMVKTCSRYALFDAYIGLGTDLGKYIEDARKEPPFRVKSGYVPPERKLRFVRLKAHFIGEIVAALRHNEDCVCVFATKKACDSMLLKIRDGVQGLDVNILWYSSDNQLRPGTDCNVLWRSDGRVRLLVYTGTIRTGLSYDCSPTNKPFDRLFLAAGVCEKGPTARDFLGQATARCRTFTDPEIVAYETAKGFVFGALPFTLREEDGQWRKQPSDDERMHTLRWIKPKRQPNKAIKPDHFSIVSHSVATEATVRAKWAKEKIKSPFLQVAERLGSACLGLFARVEAEKLNSIRCLDWQRLTAEMNIAVVVDAADGCEEREKHDRGWLLDKYADTVLLETTAEYEAVKLALEREECLPHSFGMKVNKKVLATMGAECDDPVALVPPAGLSDHERGRWTVDAEKERRRIVRSAMRRHDFDKNHQEAGDFREKLYDWFFATLHKGESRASKYWELLRIANIKCSSDEILQGLHEKDRLAEVATEKQKTAIATKKAADLLKKLGVTLDDVVPSIKGGVSTWAAPGVDGRTLKAVRFEKGQFPDADFQCLSVVGLMAVAVSTTRRREKRVNGHKLRTDHLAAVKRAHPELKHQDAVRLANASYTRQKRPTRSQTTVYEIKPDDLGWKRVPEPECKAVGRKPGSLTYADYAKLDATPLKDKGLAAYCRANLPPPPTLGMLALLL